MNGFVPPSGGFFTPRSAPHHITTKAPLSRLRMTLAAPPPPASLPTPPSSTPQPGVVHTIQTPDEFDTLLRAAGPDRIVVADFMAKWCRKCVYLKARLPKLAQTHPTTYFAIIDVNKVARLPREYSITKMPTFVIIRNAQIVESYVGAQEAPQVTQNLRELVAKYCGAPIEIAE